MKPNKGTRCLLNCVYWIKRALQWRADLRWLPNPWKFVAHTYDVQQWAKQEFKNWRAVTFQ